jgi:polyketide synthase PksL
MDSRRDIFAALQAGRIDQSAALKALRTLDSAGAPHSPGKPLHSPAPPIAVVGMAGRYPDAPDLGCYWANLAAGRDSVRRVPASRWDATAYFDERRGEPGKIYAPWIAPLDDVDAFDSLFFRISPAEAQYIDPQQRIFLETAYHAFEDAGYAPSSLDGIRCGTYLGIMSNEYAMMLAATGAPIVNATGNAFSIAAARVAYHLNLKGPALAVDTACSSSLVTLHLACQALRAGEIDMALAGGVSLYLAPESYMAMCAAGMLSPTGACKAFDDAADGFVPGEGVGCIVLKRLTDAERDGDRILGVVVASGTNQDGRTNGMSAPSGASQAELVREVYAFHGIDARSIDYYEAHGTGTRLGDPVELAALASVFREAGVANGACQIGSVKTNIGHASAAAGVAGIHKILLSLIHESIPPSLHFSRPNQHFDFTASPFEVTTATRPWPARADRPRRAAVSSFGLSGTNAHVVIEEYKGQADERRVPGPFVFVLSATDTDRLTELARNLRTHAEEMPESRLADLAYTLQTGRVQLARRWAAAVDSREGLIYCLTTLIDAGGVASQALVVHGVGEDDASPMLDLARQWLRGNEVIHWPMRRRTGAPGYPFARARHWLPGTMPPSPSGQRALLRQAWFAADPVTADDVPHERLVTVLVQREDPFCLVLVEALRLYFPRIRYITPETFDGSATPPSDILIDPSGCAMGDIPVASWLRAVQTAVAQRPVRIIGLTCAGGQGKGTPIARLAATFYRSLRAEHPSIASTWIELPTGVDVNEMAGWVAREVASTEEFAVRRLTDGRRERLDFEVVSFEPPSTARVAVPTVLSSDDHVWVTGGTRGIGLLCAWHLARQHGVRRFLLSGRGTELDPEAQTRRDGILAAMASLGAQVRMSSAALDNQEELAATLRDACDAHGPVTGLLHCAGLCDWTEPAFATRPVSRMLAVLQPKVAGLEGVLRHLEPSTLKRVILFSSVASAIPSLAAGQLDYAMANGYQDEVARHLCATWPIVSVQWPNWRDTGMGEVRSRAYARTGLLSLTDDEGLAWLDRFLAPELAGPVLLPATVATANPWSDWLAPTLAGSPAGADQGTMSGVAAPDEFGSARRRLQEWIARRFAQELKLDVEVIDARARLIDFGVDSIMLTQLLRPLNEHAMQPLDPSLLFEHDTIASLVDWLLERRREIVEGILGAPAFPEEHVDRVSGPLANGTRGVNHAVIGMSCRFPGAPSPADYWELLRSGGTGIASFDAEPGSSLSRFHAGTIARPTVFDASHFGLRAEDVQAMDPQALLLMELCAEVFHDAGYSPSEWRGRRVGVFLGGRSRHMPEEALLDVSSHPVRAIGQNYLSANLSQVFDLRGTSLLVDTACSSALVALQAATHALEHGDIEAAIVGGVSLLQGDEAHRLFARRGLLSPDDKFHIFDERASGIVLGEGAGLVLIRPLRDAVAAGDRVEAIVKAVAVNNDGRTAGPSSPSFAAQVDVMRSGLEKSGVGVDAVRYIEANGSGSQVTDLLELKAVHEVYPLGTVPRSVGSAKPNLGHLLCAEGIAALIKAVLILKHRQIVPFRSAQRPLPHQPFPSSDLVFTREPMALSDARPVAVINSFADGGTNAHVVLQASGHISSRKPLAMPSRTQTPIVHIPSPAPVAVVAARRAWPRLSDADVWDSHA